MNRSDLPIIGIIIGAAVSGVAIIVGVVWLVVTVAKWAWGG